MIKIASQNDTSASWSNACIGRQGSFKTIYVTVTESIHTAVFWAANTTADVCLSFGTKSCMAKVRENHGHGEKGKIPWQITH